jgi:hypothetical protein
VFDFSPSAKSLLVLAGFVLLLVLKVARRKYVEERQHELPDSLQQILAGLSDDWVLDSYSGFCQGWIARLSCQGRHFSVLEDTTRLFLDEEVAGESRMLMRPRNYFETDPREVTQLLLSAIYSPAVK